MCSGGSCLACHLWLLFVSLPGHGQWGMDSAPGSSNHCLYLPICLGGLRLALKVCSCVHFSVWVCVFEYFYANKGVCVHVCVWHRTTWPGHGWEARGRVLMEGRGGLVCGKLPLWSSSLPGSRLQGPASRPTPGFPTAVSCVSCPRCKCGKPGCSGRGLSVPTFLPLCPLGG